MKYECVPITEVEMAAFCALPGLGTLTPEDVRDHAPDAGLLLRQARIDVARCSLWWTAVPSIPGERVGLVGHYAARDLPAGAALLRAACERLRAQGCTVAIGPMDGNTWRRYRLLTSRGTEAVYFLEPDNPDEWPAHFEKAAFAPLAQYFSAKCARLGDYPCDETLDAAIRAGGYATRCIDPRNVGRELGILWRLASDAFSGNFLYTPVTEAEFRRLYEPVMAVVRPELVHIVERDGEPLAFVFGVPDILQAKRGVAVDTVILKTMGVVRSQHGRRLGTWLLDVVIARARDLGYRQAILALMHEANPSRRLGRATTREFRRYTLFGRGL